MIALDLIKAQPKRFQVRPAGTVARMSSRFSSAAFVLFSANNRHLDANALLCLDDHPVRTRYDGLWLFSTFIAEKNHEEVHSGACKLWRVCSIGQGQGGAQAGTNGNAAATPNNAAKHKGMREGDTTGINTGAPRRCKQFAAASAVGYGTLSAGSSNNPINPTSTG
jgi:hypothetical protein